MMNQHVENRVAHPWAAVAMGALLCICLSTRPVNAQEMDSPPRWELTTDVDGELWRNTSGGLDTGSRLLGHAKVDLNVDSNQTLGIQGLALHGSLLYTNGKSINELTGSAQGISNIEAPRALRLYEAWAEWLSDSGQQSVKLGLYDLNSEFDVIDAASLFINPSHGIGPDFSQSGRNGPSIFPTTSLALRVWLQHAPWTLQAVVLDGVPGDPDHETRTTLRVDKGDGLLYVGEAGVVTETGWRAALGYWRYSAAFDDLVVINPDDTPLQRRGNAGLYALTEKRLIAQSEQRSGVSVYLRYGVANAHINPVNSYVGSGIVLSGITAAHPEDHFALSFAMATAGQPFREAQLNNGVRSTRTEQITELTYYLPITSWLALQPDVQHVRHPGFDAQIASSWVVGVRFEVTAGLRR